MSIEVTVNTVIIGLIVAAVGWLFRTTIQLGKDVVKLETAFKYYLERVSKGAAMVLDSPNPTPPEIRRLLQCHYAGQRLANGEREILIEYLDKLRRDTSAPKSERSAAIELLATMETLRMVARHESG